MGQTETKVEWRSDAPPTEDEVGNNRHVLVTWDNDFIGLVQGRDARMHWHFHTRPCVIAWAYTPQPYKPPYEPPTTWQRTGLRNPTEKDADEHGMVATIQDGGLLRIANYSWVAEHHSTLPLWIPTAALMRACSE